MKRTGSQRSHLRLVAQDTADPRAARTRESLFLAAEALTAAGPASLSVSEISDAAGVSRSSFYAHFADLDAFAIAYLEHTFTVIRKNEDTLLEQSISPADEARQGYRLLVQHLATHYEMYRSVLTVGAMRAAYEVIVTTFARELLATRSWTAPEGVVSEVAAIHTAAGAIAVITRWLDGSLDLSDDELVDQLVTLIPPHTPRTRAETDSP